MSENKPIHVVGGGLAGSEAAWQVARAGVPVVLHEMRPERMTEAHQGDGYAELVCSNSFRSDDAIGSAIGLLHEELRRCNSLIMAAADANLPIFTPGWEDSTLGNILAAKVLDCSLKSPDIVKGGLHAMQALADWYREDDSPTGLLQVGGGIAGDFAISVVPMLRQDAKVDVSLWSWFAQISESRPSYGGYSGAPPNEKISWEKLGADTPRFVIESDATIVLPLLLASLE